MLIRKPVLERIRSGDISLAFRRWKRESVNSGSTIKTAIGLISISEVSECEEDEITIREAKAAGFENRSDLLRELNGRSGNIYRIHLCYAGEDPRIELREDAKLSDSDIREITEKLERYDKASRRGDWTLKFLELIKEHPMLPAGELAERASTEKEWLKTNVRKLKNLGLTISHQPGYELSPRGQEYLRRSTKRA
ncbi:MAG: hypothetical protein AAGA96_17465 [Verrucomicrobiota bacterium]